VTRKRRLLIFIPLCLAVVFAGAVGVFYLSEGPGGLVQLFASVDRTDMMRAEEYHDPSGAVLPYRIYVPAQYDAATQYPLVLFLHGSGESGGDNRAQTRKNSVMQTLLSEENLARYPCIVLAPQCPKEQRWYADDGARDNRAALMGLLERTKAAYAVDPARVYITGVSMGGFGAFGMLAAYPDYFAAAVPICGFWGWDDAPLMKEVPIWAFQGAKDKVVPPQGTREIVNALREAGGNVKYTEYPNERHASWERAYREPALFPWLFAQVRG